MELRCPRCKGALILDPGPPVEAGQKPQQALLCDPCRAEYPVRCDIPDLRLAPSPEISFEEDLQIAEALAKHEPHETFEELVDRFYEMRPPARPELRTAHLTHFEVEEEQALAAFSRFDPTDRGPYLDLGCGMGRYLATAAPTGREAIGVDAALYQLVLARKLLGGESRRVQLVAANAEALPFADGGFTAATATDLLEHVPEPQKVLAELGRVLDDGARVVLTTPNRFSLTPEPHVGIWGLGFRSRPSAERLVREKLGIDYSSIRPFSYGRLCQTFDDAFPGKAVIHAPIPGPREMASFPGLKRLFAEVYSMIKSPLLAPYFLVDAVKDHRI
ncbi:MAG: class I SAM-dependent methyltransferase [Bryobacterales bacterium]|nr:class I SAM-dependent methyltransferase [Acidobacteriota bacterium]MCB9385273.1 class I SAM-dependent methyltransferase [Bryobacterales bacterium]